MAFPMNLPTRAHFFAPQAMLRRRASPSSRRHRPRADPPSPPLASSSPTQSVRHFITLNNKPYPDVVNGFNSDEEAAGRHGVYHYPNQSLITSQAQLIPLSGICSFSCSCFMIFLAQILLFVYIIRHSPPIGRSEPEQ